MRASAGETKAGERAAWWPGLAALGVLTAVYLFTLQTDVNGSAHDYLLDVGEIQVALNVWGTIHYTGYPLYTMLSALLTAVGRTLGVNPAAAASLTSTIWALAALLLVYRLLWRVTDGRRFLPALAVLMLGLVETFWLHSIMAEVYSFSLLWITAVLLLGVRLSESWEERTWLAALFCLGTAVTHHRLMVMLIPVLFLLILPTFPRQKLRRIRFWLVSATAFFLPFLAYLYLPLRAWQEAYWVYGEPGTWQGFWQQFTGSEVTGGLLRRPQGAAWLANAGFLAEHMTRQLPLWLIAPGIGGLLWLARAQRWWGLAFLAGTAVFMLFVYLFPPAVWAPATLMPSLLLLVVGLTYLLHRLASLRRGGVWAAGAALLAAALFFFGQNRPFVASLVRDTHGRDLITRLQPLADASLPGGKNVVAIPWGTSFSAANYGRHVTGELQNLELVDHRANFGEIVTADGKILTPDFTFGFWPLAWWQETLGTAHLGTAVPGVVMISRQPLFQEAAAGVNFDVGNGVHIRQAEIARRGEDELNMTLYWEAMQPMTRTFSTAVHLLRQNPPQSPDDLLAQADAIHPVSGQYPTTLWQPGEIVRDDYRLILPPGVNDPVVRVSMYYRDETGAFVNGDWLILSLP